MIKLGQVYKCRPEHFSSRWPVLVAIVGWCDEQLLGLDLGRDTTQYYTTKEISDRYELLEETKKVEVIGYDIRGTLYSLVSKVRGMQTLEEIVYEPTNL